MGVKDLWTIIDPSSEEISINNLDGKSVAIDLSAWICDSQAVGQSHRSIQRPDLRNTFFRASRLVLSNVTPIFVLEGEAPKLKHATISSRNASQRPGKATQTKAPRSQFMSRLKPMVKLLDAMGLSYIQSRGEAEKLCAYLNKEKYVDAVISQDSDCLLYGAQQVLRHFSVARGNATARKYCITKIQEEINLDREKLIVLALLLGCDYGQKGVPGVGKEQAMTFLTGVDGSPLARLRSWRHNTYLEQLDIDRKQMSQPRSCPQCWHPGTIKKHADKGCVLCGTLTSCVPHSSMLQNKDEKSEWQLLELQIRSKALQDPLFPSEEIINEFLYEEMPLSQIKIQWRQPNVHQLMEIGVKQLGWERDDCRDKVLQLLSRWQCYQQTNDMCPSPPLQLNHIVKTRVQNGVRCVEVQWEPYSSLQTTDILTIEPVAIFRLAYPSVWEDFEQKKLTGEKTKKKKTTRQCVSENVDELGEMVDMLGLDESIPEHELSAIISSIISGNN